MEQTEGGQVIVPSGRWGWAQELIGSLGFDAEWWWQVRVAGPSEPRLHIHCVAGHRGNCHSSPSQRDRNRKRGSKGRRRKDGGFFVVLMSLLLLFQLSENSKDRPQPPFTSFLSHRLVSKGSNAYMLAFGLLWVWTVHLPGEKWELWLFQSQPVSGRGGESWGQNEASWMHDAGVTHWSPGPNCGPGKLL